MGRLLILAPILFATFAQAENWSLEIATGTAHNFSTNLTVQQSGQADLRFDAQYETRAFEGPLYYSARVGWWRGFTAWEVEFIHHKIFVKDPPPEIGRFAISHGYNFLLVNHAWNIHGFLIRAGGGVLLPHPETRVRGKPAETGYELTGPAAQIAAGKRFVLGNGFFFSVEGKLAFARAAVTVADGGARVPNVSLHGLFGFGRSF